MLGRRPPQPPPGDAPGADADDVTRPTAALSRTPAAGRTTDVAAPTGGVDAGPEEPTVEANGNGNGNGTPTEPLGARVARAVSETAERAAGQLQRLTAGSAGRTATEEEATPAGDEAVSPVTPESPGSRARARSARAAELVARRSTASEGGRAAREPVARRSTQDESPKALWAMRVAALALVAVMLFALVILVSALA